jgi:hypothetical protein
MIPADLDARVLASLEAGHATARAISEAEGINSLERLESRGQVIRRGSQWKVLG